MQRLPLILLALLTPVSGRGQAALSAAVSVQSQYQARGLTTTNRKVYQPELAVVVVMRGVEVSAGAFSSFEGGRYDDAQSHISENGGQRAGLAELEFWMQATRATDDLRLSVGLTTYRFPNARGTTSDWNTSELFAHIEWTAPLSPFVRIWHDVSVVDGAYAEVGVTHTLGLIALGAVAGWNLGQTFDELGKGGYYARRGLTHAELSAASTLTVGTVQVSPTATLMLPLDPAARLVAPGESAATKLWFGSTVRWRRPFVR